MRRTLHDLHRRVVAVLEVLRQPHRREVAPPQLLDKHVPVHQHLPDVARVVPPDLVVLDAFVLAVVLVVEFGDQVRQRPEWSNNYPYSSSKDSSSSLSGARCFSTCRGG